MKPFFLLLAAAFFVSCQADSPTPSTEEEPVPMGTGRVETAVPKRAF